MRSLVLALTLSLVAARSGAEERIAHGRFESVALLRPTGAARSVALLLGGSADHAASEAIGRALAARGAFVVRVDTPALLRQLARDGGTCVLADGDLENLSHFAQGYASLPTYYRPWLVGVGPGAAFAYAMLAQAPPTVFAGGLSVDFAPEVALAKPLCPGSGLRSSPTPTGQRLEPGPRLAVPWLVLSPAGNEGDAASAFAHAVPGAASAAYPPGAGRDAPSAYLGALVAGYGRLAASVATAGSLPPHSLSDLPLVEVPATGAGDSFAVFISGDGGWAGLDAAVAGQLAARGIPVVGVDSLRYFWRARTPNRVGADLGRVLLFYADHWRRSRALVIGFSQGADVLPFALNRLKPASARLVERAVLLGPGLDAAFEFHVTHWIGLGHGDLPTLPEALKLDGRRTLCVYGRDDGGLCPKLGPAHARAVALPGGHHFGGNYGELTQLILSTDPGR